MVHDRDHPAKHPNITYTKNHPGRQGSTRKVSQTFFCNTSVQQTIVKAQTIVFLISVTCKKYQLSACNMCLSQWQVHLNDQSIFKVGRPV